MMGSKSSFKLTLEVRAGDTNSGNHLSHTSLIGMCHHARIIFLKSLGFSEISGEENSIILRQLKCHFSSQSYFGDMLLFDLYVGNIRKHDLKISYKIKNKKTQKLVASLEENIVFYDYNKRSIIKIPIEIFGTGTAFESR